MMDVTAWRQYTALVGAFMKMNARGRTGRSAYTRAISIFFSYGFSALYLAFALSRSFHEPTFVFVTITVTMYLAGFTVLSSYSLIMLDSHDENILSQFPLPSRVVFLARATNLMVYIALITVPFALPLSVVLAIGTRSFIAGAEYVIVMYVSALWTTGVFILFHNFLLTYSRRSGNLFGVMQIILVFLLLFFYQALPRLAGEQGAIDLFLHTGWAQLLPPAWFTTLYATIDSRFAVTTSAVPLFLVIGSILVMAGFLRSRWMLLPDFSMLRPVLPTASTDRLMRVFRRRPFAPRTMQGRAGSDLFSDLFVRDRTLRFQILPLLMMAVAVAIYGTYSGELHSPFDGQFFTLRARLHIAVLIFYLFSTRHVEQVLARAIAPNTVWLLAVHAPSTLRRYADGVFTGVFWRIQVPQAVVLFLVFMITLTPLESALQALFLVVAGQFQSGTLRLFRTDIPLSRAESQFAALSRFGQFFAIVPFVVIALTLHALCSGTPVEFITMLLALEIITLILHQAGRRRRFARVAMACVTALAAGALVTSCATQKPPEGGPVDKEPPAIIETVPAQGATHVTGDRVTLRFSEYVDRQSFASALHVSPLQTTPPEISWSGRRVDIIFPDGFQPKRTYVIAVGSTVKDRNAGNPMSATFTLAFSTGDSVDAGAARGRVFDAKSAGISIFAYQLDARSADTLDPSRLRPDYLVQTGADGSFELTHITPGTYRILAVRDRTNNALYDIGSDEFGVLASDPLLVAAHDSAAVALRYMLATEDTTGPYTQSVEAAASTRIMFTLSEPPSRSITTDDIAVTDSAHGTNIPLLSVAPLPSKKNTYTAVTASALPGGVVLFEARGVRDDAGNAWVAAQSVRSFVSSADADTLRPSLVRVFPSNNAADVAADTSITFLFSHPMRDGVKAALADSAAAAVPLELVRTAANAFIAHPSFAAGRAYKLTLDLTTCVDSIRGMRTGDTTLAVKFRTLSDDETGSISGVVEGADSARSSCVRIRASQPGSAHRVIRAQPGGRFTAPRIMPGTYQLDAFEDSDGNGKFTPGRPHPFSPAERFGILTDTVRVRARWETSGVRIRIPR